MQPASMTLTAEVHHMLLSLLWQYHDVDDQKELVAVAQTPDTSLTLWGQPDADAA